MGNIIWGQQIGNNNVIGRNNFQINHQGSVQQPGNSYSHTEPSNYSTRVDLPRGPAPDQTDFSEPIVSSRSPMDPMDMYKPTTSNGKVLANKLKRVVKFIDHQNHYTGVPLIEAYEGHLSDIYGYTTLNDNLISLLQDMNILDADSSRRFRKTKATEHEDCCSQIYDSLFKNGNVDHLVCMWEKTKNNVLIQRSQIWIDNKYPSQ